jgi:hypothetical protein
MMYSFLINQKEYLPFNEEAKPHLLEGIPSGQRGGKTSSTGRDSFWLMRHSYLTNRKESLLG